MNFHQIQSPLNSTLSFHFQHSQDDKEVYCSQHVPKTGPGKFDTESVGIKLAMNAPKSAPYVNEQIRPGGKATFDADAMAIRQQISAQSNRKESQARHSSIRNGPFINDVHKFADPIPSCPRYILKMFLEFSHFSLFLRICDPNCRRRI